MLHVITHLDMGGAEVVAMALIEALRGQIDFSLFVVLRAPELNAIGRLMASRLQSWGVSVRFGTTRGFKSGGVVFAARALGREIKRFEPDVVHVHTEVPELTLAVARILSPRARRAQLLRTVHNATLWIAWHRMGRWVTDRLARDDAVAVSRAAADADEAIATRRARPRAAVIYNGVRHVPRAAQPARGGPFRLLFAGRLVHQKGADLLPAILEAAHLRTSQRDVKVTIAGSGVLHDEISRALQGGLAGWAIEMVMPIERLPEKLGDFDAVLLPSRFEGFGLLAAEVLIAGVPLVTTDAPGLDEVVPTDYPLKAPVDDVEMLGEMLSKVIIGDRDYAAIAGHYGEDLALRFNLDAMARSYAQRYHRIAASGQAIVA